MTPGLAQERPARQTPPLRLTRGRRGIRVWGAGHRAALWSDLCNRSSFQGEEAPASAATWQPGVDGHYPTPGSDVSALMRPWSGVWFPRRAPREGSALPRLRSIQLRSETQREGIRENENHPVTERSWKAQGVCHPIAPGTDPWTSSPTWQRAASAGMRWLGAQRRTGRGRLAPICSSSPPGTQSEQRVSPRRRCQHENHPLSTAVPAWVCSWLSRRQGYLCGPHTLGQRPCVWASWSPQQPQGGAGKDCGPRPELVT